MTTNAAAVPTPEPSILPITLPTVSSDWEGAAAAPLPITTSEPSILPPDDDDDDEDTAAKTAFTWTAATVLQSMAVFVLAGIAEIGGGWLVWQTVREGKPAWWAVLGSCILILYGFIPTLQPTDSFGRIYAVYGGFFIVLSFLWGWAFDGNRPDKGDITGMCIAFAGVLLILFWPR